MPTTIDSAGITFNDATSLTSANIGTAQLVNGSVTAAKLGTTEQKQIAKAWVNFDGTGVSTSGGIPATWSQSGTTVTVTTSTAHGFTIGKTFGSSAPQTGLFTVLSVVSPTVFTYTTTTTATNSGSSTIYPNAIRSSYNVSSVTKNGTGDYTVNFATAMADANYSVVGMSRNNSLSATDPNTGYGASICLSRPTAPTTSAFRIWVIGLVSTGSAASIVSPQDQETISIQVFGN